MATRKERRRAAVAAAEDLVAGRTVFGLVPGGLFNRCQQVTRTLLGVGGGYPSARAAWLGTAKADRHAGRRPPAGVPCYYKGGTYWHAVLSAGDGYVFSTDIKRRGKVDKVRLELIEKRWGYPYLGWTETINGQRIYGSAK